MSYLYQTAVKQSFFERKYRLWPLVAYRKITVKTTDLLPVFAV
jgi:hypothetical protein